MSTDLDEYGRSHGLTTKEWRKFVKKGEVLPIIKEVRRREDLSDAYDAIMELLMADKSLDLSPIELIRVALHTMRELRLIEWELTHGIGELPDNHPKMANAIQRAVAQMDKLVAQKRVERREAPLWDSVRRHMKKLTLEVEFDGQGNPDDGADEIEGEFTVIEEDEDDDGGTGEGSG